MNNQLPIALDELFNFTEEERKALTQMTDEEINKYWQAQQASEELQAYIEHPDTPEIARGILNLSEFK